MLTEVGPKIPEWWGADRFSRERKKALLRCLIDKVVLHHAAPDCVHCRAVWKRGETSEVELSVIVGAWSLLSGSREMEQLILKLARQRKPDKDIATDLTKRGYHSPRHMTLVRSTLQIVRLCHGLMRNRSQSCPRQIPGFLMVPQLTIKFKLEPSWICDRIHNSMVQVTVDPDRKLYIFPDTPKILSRFRKLRAGKLNTLRF